MAAGHQPPAPVAGLLLSSGGGPRTPIPMPEKGQLTGHSGEVHDNQQAGHEEEQGGADDERPNHLGDSDKIKHHGG